MGAHRVEVERIDVISVGHDINCKYETICALRELETSISFHRGPQSTHLTKIAAVRELRPVLKIRRRQPARCAS